uniref:Argininosuccinate lyase n=2 Tax=Candidatus Methanogaster sp. ANME-2c ERB4 TaxID=2759911 RepID=A0A7G9YDD1_9EURY|nr:argininosuccinate lyase [Methanosarcinales archaeon ANME-2c ERB4]
MRKARLSAQPADVLRFTSSIDSDKWIFDADINVDRAHVVMLTEEGIITAETSSLILSAISVIQKDGISALPPEEDIHAAIESKLIEMVGEDTGGRMHTGRSRNDEVATCIRMRLRDELLKMMRELIGLRQVLITHAKEHIETLIPGFTHTQHAQPTTLAHHLLAHAGALARDFDRLGGAYTRVNQSPLGAAAFAGTGFPVNRMRTCELLGFDGTIENSMDAVAARDFMIESVAAFANLMTDLSRIAAELILWSTSEFDYITIDDRYASTSSIMPQKKNPDVAELIRGKTGSVIAAATGILTIAKALPMSYNRDLQDATPHLGSAAQDTLASVHMTAGMIDTITVNKENLARQATAGFAMATELADTLVRSCGISFRTAHQIVGRLVRTGVSPSLEAIDEIAVSIANIRLSDLGLDGAAVASALDPMASVRTHAGGGPAPDDVTRVIAIFEDKLDADRVLLDRRSEQVNLAMQLLDRETAKYV